MRLLTLNCHAWQEEDQLEKMDILAETIVERSYDVIALQEVSIKKFARYDNVTSEDHYGEVLLKKLEALGCSDYKMVWTFSHHSYGWNEEGVAILSRVPILDVDEFFVSRTTDPEKWKSRAIIRAAIEWKGEEIDIYSCHTGWWSDKDEPFPEQVDRLMEKIDPSRLSILAGDFNNDARIKGEGYTYLLEQGLYDTYSLAENKDKGITVPGRIAGWSQNDHALRIDYILATRAIEVSSSTVIFNGQNKPIISDHYGVEVEINI
ncbi:endonuclease/exonuclease/phosphatase family protein [Jeotgalibacillus proteolyticus]|uniref:Endonuclease n=1 Tax=Jeotgalibacillus proteolyticus TaxID=2082395 RepID=A0A2S5GBT9_9BACL|nr:endonuclease/exonuclease/phosphatase family protein [Jeotgalibacillus proteolyticus]PPA70381.1 endonuclease [Jeotgalibacillus proteolyticus]